jgi:hypothetical protein
MKGFVLALTAAGIIGLPLPARAQPTTSTTSAASTFSSEALPRIDVSASAGWFAANETSITVYGGVGAWYGTSWNRSIAAGYYWTEHLKTEVEAGWNGQGEIYGQHPDASRNGSETFGPVEHYFSSRNLVVGQQYQFGHNAWFHPHVSAGAVVQWVDRTDEIGPLYESRTGRIVRPARTVELATARRANAFVGTGFKAYMSTRAFFRMDLRIAVGTHVDHVLTSFGFGFDFQGATP